MEFIPIKVPKNFSQGLLLGPALFSVTNLEKEIKSMFVTSAPDGGFG